MSTDDNRFHIPSAFKLPFFLTLCLMLFLLDPEIYVNIQLRWSFWGVSLSLLIWQLWLLYRSAAVGRSLEIQIRITRAHYVQAMVQLCIYLYWGWYWRSVYDQATLILAQLVFAYVFDMLLCWSRRSQWILGFGQFPIVLSTNLFLWFKDDWFIWQFAMIAVGQLGKEFFRWTKDGRVTHIFNPSGFSLTVFSIGLLATGNTELTWGREIAKTLLSPDSIYVVIFLLGLVVQYFFSVTLMTLAAVTALYLLNVIYTSATGVYYFIDINIPIAVFLGLHLLVTDPYVAAFDVAAFWVGPDDIRIPVRSLCFRPVRNAGMDTSPIILRQVAVRAFSQSGNSNTRSMERVNREQVSAIFFTIRPSPCHSSKYCPYQYLGIVFFLSLFDGISGQGTRR